MFSKEIVQRIAEELKSDSHAATIIVSALRAAADIYTHDAKTMGGIGRLSSHFSMQARDASTLADMLEEAI